MSQPGRRGRCTALNIHRGSDAAANIGRCGIWALLGQDCWTVIMRAERNSVYIFGLERCSLFFFMSSWRRIVAQRKSESIKQDTHWSSLLDFEHGNCSFVDIIYFSLQQCENGHSKQQATCNKKHLSIVYHIFSWNLSKDLLMSTQRDRQLQRRTFHSFSPRDFHRPEKRAQCAFAAFSSTARRSVASRVWWPSAAAVTRLRKPWGSSAVSLTSSRKTESKAGPSNSTCLTLRIGWLWRFTVWIVGICPAAASRYVAMYLGTV